MKKLLGIDVGTTGTKTLLVTEDGEVIGSSYCGYETKKPRPGYSEQNPLDWWNAVVRTVREACAGCDANDVAAISLSAQGGTVVPTDSGFDPLKYAVVWDDARCENERRQFLSEVGAGGTMFEKTGWGLSCSLPALQIRWIKNNEPDIFEKKPLYLTVADYISAKLTGKPCIDMSDAGINQLIDVRKGCYDKELLDFAGITEDQLPKLVKSGTAVGNLTAEAAKELGLTEKTVFVAGAHDQYAVAVGGGAVKEGDILIGSGTSWVVTAISDRPRFETGLAQSVSAAEGMWGSLTSLSSGGVCLEWLRKNVISDGGLSLAGIDGKCENAEAAGSGLFFYPFGSITAENSEGKTIPTGTFVGMDLSNDRFDLARAVMEGVGFQIKRMLGSFDNRFDRIKLAGGASKSKFWTGLLADILGKPIVVPSVSELACVGAAIIAGVGCGLFGSAAEGYEKVSVNETTVCPDAARSEKYQAAYKIYTANAGYLEKMYL